MSGAQQRTYSSPRQKARRQRILEAARSEVSASGYDGVTMQRLAAASDVSVKTLYNLYGSKDELLLTAIEDLLQDLRSEAEASDVREGVERLIMLCDVSARQLVAMPRYSEVLAKALFRAEKDHRLNRVLLIDTFQRSLDALRISRDKGELAPDLDIETLARIFASHQWGLVLAWDKGLIPLEDFRATSIQSQLSVIYPHARGKLKKYLKTLAEAHRIQL